MINGAETWTLTKKMEQKLKAGVRDIERCMLDLTWKEKQMGRGPSEVE